MSEGEKDVLERHRQKLCDAIAALSDCNAIQEGFAVAQLIIFAETLRATLVERDRLIAELKAENEQLRRTK